MNHDPFNKAHHLRTKLDEYHVDIPNFPMQSKKKRWERLINFLASPAKDPLEPLVSTTAWFTVLKFAPIMGMAAFSIIQLFFLT
ncbi:hypothetical protein [Cytobacillus massiliigabonensis]|uniref:hypothetical protein n=1 Tax=Cytobacillus massiliigabonensis TaxID=1871011 RepID=UPI000C84D82B|nr:hypothetical protein [Cytobacillus massiliigabonensis]